MFIAAGFANAAMKHPSRKRVKNSAATVDAAERNVIDYHAEFS